MVFNFLLCAFFPFSLIHLVLQQICVYHIFNASSHEPRQCMKKQRYHFDNKSPYSQSYGFSSSHVWMWELDHKEGWVLWCWTKLLRVPWTARRSNQSILKEISPEYSLEGLVVKLKLQYFGHPMRSSDSLEKTLMLRKIEGRKRRGWHGRDGWMASPTQWIWVWASSGRWWRTGKPGMLQTMRLQRVGHNWSYLAAAAGRLGVGLRRS